MRVEDFRIHRRYLRLLFGEEAGEAALAEADRRHGEPPGQTHISTMRFVTHCLDHMRLRNDESYGLAKRPVPLGSFGMLMAAAAQADDFEGALDRFAEAALQLRPDITMSVQKGREGLSLSLRFAGERTARSELMIETYAVLVQCGFRWLTDRQLKIVHLRVHDPLVGLERSLLPAIMNCPTLQQGQGATLRWAAEDARLPLAAVKYQNWAAHELVQFRKLLEEAADAMNAAAEAPATPGIALRVRQAIATGARSEVAASSALGMSPATLRRKLAQASSSFRRISAEMQRNAAESLFATGTPLEEIASEIGYSDVRSLRRACRRWFGVSPSAYRRGRRVPLTGAATA